VRGENILQGVPEFADGISIGLAAPEDALSGAQFIAQDTVALQDRFGSAPAACRVGFSELLGGETHLQE